MAGLGMSNEDVHALLAATRGFSALVVQVGNASSTDGATQVDGVAHNDQEASAQLHENRLLPTTLPMLAPNTTIPSPTSSQKRQLQATEVVEFDHGAKRQRKSTSPPAPEAQNLAETMINDLVSNEELNAILADVPADLTGFDGELIDVETMKQALELLASQNVTDFGFQPDSFLLQQQQSPSSQHGSSDSTPPPEMLSGPSTLPQDPTNLPEIDLTSIPKDRDEMILWIAHQVKKIGEQQQELDMPPSDETDPERIAERERVREENRERKRRWREGNADRNKDNDLRCRVTKRANKIYGTESTLEKKMWIDDEFVKRRAKRLSKEHAKNYDGEGNAMFSLRDNGIENKTTELLANVFSGEAGAAESMQRMLEGGGVDLQALSEALQTIAEDETVMRHITTLLESGTTGEIPVAATNDIEDTPAEVVGHIKDTPNTLRSNTGLETDIPESTEVNATHPSAQSGQINLEEIQDFNAVLKNLLDTDASRTETQIVDSGEGGTDRFDNTEGTVTYNEPMEDAAEDTEETTYDAATLEAIQAALASFAEGNTDNMELIQMLAEHLPQDIENGDDSVEMSGVESAIERQNPVELQMLDQIPETVLAEQSLNAAEGGNDEELVGTVGNELTNEAHSHDDNMLETVNSESAKLTELIDTQMSIAEENNEQSLTEGAEPSHDTLSNMDLENMADIDPDQLLNLTTTLDQDQLQALLAMVGQALGGDEDPEADLDMSLRTNDVEQGVINSHSSNEEDIVSGGEQSIDDILINNHDIDAQMQAIARAYNIDMSSPEFTSIQAQTHALHTNIDSNNDNPVEFSSTFMQNLLAGNNKQPDYSHLTHTYDPPSFHNFQNLPPPTPPVCTTSVFPVNPTALPKKGFKRLNNTSTSTNNNTVPPPRTFSAPIPPPPPPTPIPSSTNSLTIPLPPTTLPFRPPPSSTPASATTPTNYSYSSFYPIYSTAPPAKSPSSYSPSCDETAKLLIKPPPYIPLSQKHNDEDDSGLLGFLAEYAEYDISPPLDMDYQRQVNAMGFPPMLVPIAQKTV